MSVIVDNTKSILSQLQKSLKRQKWKHFQKWKQFCMITQNYYEDDENWLATIKFLANRKWAKIEK